MASWHVCMDNISPRQAGVPGGSHPFRWCVISGAVPSVPPPLTYHHSLVLCYLAGALKNNHPGHAPLLPIISVIYTNLALHFPFVLSFSPSCLPLIVFVFFCPRRCVLLTVFCFCASSFFFHPTFFSPSVSHCLSLRSSVLINMAKTTRAILSTLYPTFIIRLLHFIR